MCHPILNDIRVKLDDLTNEVLSIKASAKTYLSLEEAAKYLCISKSTLYKHTMLNNITFYKPNGKLIIMRKEDLDAWINRTKVPSNDELTTLSNLKTHNNGK